MISVDTMRINDTRRFKTVLNEELVIRRRHYDGYVFTVFDRDGIQLIDFYMHMIRVDTETDLKLRTYEIFSMLHEIYYSDEYASSVIDRIIDTVQASI